MIVDFMHIANMLITCIFVKDSRSCAHNFKVLYTRCTFTYYLDKQGLASNRISNTISTNKVVELLHIDLFGSSHIQSYEDNFYSLMTIDDYSHYIWTLFLGAKEDALDKFRI